MLRQSIQLQKEVAQINPSNLSNRSETALMYNFLGDAPLSAGDRQNAMAAYREGVRLAESMFPSMSPALARGTMMMYRKLGEHSVRTGDRGAALEFGEKARRLLDPEGPVAKSWPPETQKVLAARGTAARGHIGAALAYSVHRRQSDSEEARRWLQQALELFRAMESHPAFSAEALREMRAVQIELENLQ
jgi:tetratricopeptide (TPR) repeat protein